MPPGLEESQCASFLFFYRNIGECRKLIFLKSGNKIKSVQYKLFYTKSSECHTSWILQVMRVGEVTRVPKDNYKHRRTILKISAVQTQSSNITYMPMVPKARSPVLTSLQLQSHLSNYLLDISTCMFNSHIPRVWATLNPWLPTFPTCSSRGLHPLSR